MENITRHRICYKVLFAIILFNWLCGSKGDGDSDFKLFRAKQDIFTNPDCKDDDGKCETNSCNIYKADCHPGTTCKYCRCREPLNTFKYKNGSKRIGKCKEDQDIVGKSKSRYLYFIFINHNQKNTGTEMTIQRVSL